MFGSQENIHGAKHISFAITADGDQ